MVGLKVEEGDKVDWMRVEAIKVEGTREEGDKLDGKKVVDNFVVELWLVGGKEVVSGWVGGFVVPIWVVGTWVAGIWVVGGKEVISGWVGGFVWVSQWLHFLFKIFCALAVKFKATINTLNEMFLVKKVSKGEFERFKKIYSNLNSSFGDWEIINICFVFQILINEVKKKASKRIK